MKARQALCLLFFLLTSVGCSRTSRATEATATAVISGRVTFAGSTTVQPLAAELGKRFNVTYPDVTLEIAAGGSSVGIQAIHDGTVDIGMASRRLSEEESEGIEVHQVAVDVIAMIVGSSNPVRNLTKDQLEGIYNGEITNWSQVGGNDEEIVVGVRETTSGTRKAFDELVLDKEEPSAPLMEKLMTAGDVAALVLQNPNAIGYVGFGNLEEGLATVSVDGVEPNETNAKDGSYTLTRPLLLLTGPISQPLAMEFIDFALSTEGQQLVVDSGWIPAQ